MFKKNNRMMSPNQMYMDYNYQVLYDMQHPGNNMYNPYDLSRRITRIENYLGIRSEKEASNYQ